MFLPFSTPIADIALSERFTCPFHYTAHPLCVMAAEEVQAYLRSQHQWSVELEEGKMFGVLVVENQNGEIGYLRAFSGLLAGSNLQAGFVPPIYDLQQPDGFFIAEEQQISAINQEIVVLENNPHYLDLQTQLAVEEQAAQQAIAAYQTHIATSKVERQRRRLEYPDDTEIAAMLRESQFQKAELKRLKHYWQQRIEQIKTDIEPLGIEINRLKAERKTRSAQLQQQLFRQFELLNARGETRNLCDIFRKTPQQTPPAGAGECAAPRLLQYAYLHSLRPVAMAEFWWGKSPKTEIRRHGYYYPACKSKCEPILKHMLQGLEVEENVLLISPQQESPLEVLYEDQYLLVVNKPAGILSVPGKEALPSVYSIVRQQYPQATGPLIVHRLDMATSGVLLIAKTKEVHQHLQSQFENRSIKKRYVALLDGIISTDQGDIELPLCLDPDDRPRQMVSHEYGKPTITHYEVIARLDHQTRIAFYPYTGRTHQLRVHAAHPQGLNTPIVGDTLYGRPASRLCLHAEQIEFIHPISNETISIQVTAEF